MRESLYVQKIKQIILIHFSISFPVDLWIEDVYFSGVTASLTFLLTVFLLINYSTVSSYS